MNTEDVLRADAQPMPSFSQFPIATAQELREHYSQRCDYCSARFGAHPQSLLNRHSNMAARGEKYNYS
jgi:hypothetical protein